MPQITRDSIETAYSFLHQKRNVYVHSRLPWQQDDIEWVISMYTNEMSPALYLLLSGGRPDFLRDHVCFLQDITCAVSQLEQMLTAADA